MDEIVKKDFPRHRLAEIISRLKRGDMVRIAQNAHCSPSCVSRVLNGLATQNSPVAKNIIRIAERQIEINRWKK